MVKPCTCSMQRHSCLQLFAADLRLESGGPEEVYLIFKTDCRSFTSKAVRRDLDGVYSWGDISPTDDSAAKTDSNAFQGEAPLHEWVLEGSQASQCMHMRMRVQIFSIRDCSLHSQNAARLDGSGMHDLEGSADSDGSSFEKGDHSRSIAEKAQQSELDHFCIDAPDECLGSFEVSLLALQENPHHGVQVVSGGPLLHSRTREAVAMSRRGTPEMAAVNSQLKGSLKLKLGWEVREGFLTGSGVLTQRTDDYLQLFENLTADTDVISQHSCARLAPKKCSHGSKHQGLRRKQSPKRDVLESQKKSLRAIVAEQQGHIDTLKDLVVGSRRLLDTSLQKKRPAVASVRATGHVHNHAPALPARRGLCQEGRGRVGSPPRVPSHTSPLTVQAGRAVSTPRTLPQDMRVVPPALPPQALLNLEKSMQNSDSEVQRFLREHAHHRCDLQPLVQQLPWVGDEAMSLARMQHGR